jgi:hypothetical protein
MINNTMAPNVPQSAALQYYREMGQFWGGLPVLLFLLAVALRVAAARLTQFDGLYGQDTFAYFHYALALREAVAAGQAPPAFAWPVGYPFLVALAAVMTGPEPLAGQVVSMLAGAAGLFWATLSAWLQSHTRLTSLAHYDPFCLVRG